jgi:phenylacetate-CoA ligase
MGVTVLAAVERLARSFAHDVISWRDGLSGWKAGRDEFLRTLKKSPQTLTRDVEAKLRSTLAHAFETVPYYRETWTAAGIDPSAFRQVGDLQRFPCVNKEIVKARKSSLVSSLHAEDTLDMELTGGTTGTQTSFYRDHACTVSRAGRQWGILGLCGYRPGMKRALVWGVHSDLPAGRANRTLKGWFREFARGQETLACTVMSEHDLTEYQRRVIDFGPDIMYGYPSAMEQLGRFITDRRLHPIRVKTIIATAERLATQQRSFLEQVYGGELFNLYCTREYGCVGFECDRHDGFHIDTESVFVEITRDGQPVAPGEIGEITITDLLNRGMPLIRSRTGDMGALAAAPCGCGSPLPLLKSLHGRVTDTLYRPDGSVVAGLMLPDLFADLPGIVAAQYVQTSIKALDVLLVVDDRYSKQVEQEAYRQVRELMGDEMEIRLVRVQEIRRNTRSGKYQEVICKVTAEEVRAYRKGATP